MRDDAVQQRWARFSLALARMPANEHSQVLAELDAEFPHFVALPEAAARDFLIRSHVSLPSVLTGTSVPMSFPSGARWEQPTCECDDVTVNGYPAEQITLTFHTSRSVAEMAPYADPRTWPTCSSFWVAMTKMSLFTSGANWVGTFEEVLEVVPGYPMTTPLAFSYSAAPTNDHVRSEYWLLEETSYIDVDEGSIDISVDTDPSCPAGMPTKVVAIKTICWKSKALRDIPSLLCATVWGELGLNMAERCGV